MQLIVFSRSSIKDKWCNVMCLGKIFCILCETSFKISLSNSLWRQSIICPDSATLDQQRSGQTQLCWKLWSWWTLIWHLVNFYLCPDFLESTMPWSLQSICLSIISGHKIRVMMKLWWHDQMRHLMMVTLTRSWEPSPHPWSSNKHWHSDTPIRFPDFSSSSNLPTRFIITSSNSFIILLTTCRRCRETSKAGIEENNWKIEEVWTNLSPFGKSQEIQNYQTKINGLQSYRWYISTSRKWWGQ